MLDGNATEFVSADKKITIGGKLSQTVTGDEEFFKFAATLAFTGGQASSLKLSNTTEIALAASETMGIGLATILVAGGIDEKTFSIKKSNTHGVTIGTNFAPNLVDDKTVTKVTTGAAKTVEVPLCKEVVKMKDLGATLAKWSAKLTLFG